MKTTVVNETMVKAMNMASRCAPKRTTLPILEHCLLTADATEQTLTLSASNLAWGLVHTMPARVTEGGQTTISTARFTEWVKSLPAGSELELEGDAEKHTLQARTSSSRAWFAGHNPADFPVLPDPAAGGDAWGLHAAELRTALARVTFAAATDESHPVLTGVQCEIEGDAMTLAGADGFRLSQVRLHLNAPALTNCQLLIPAETLREVERLPWEAEEIVITGNTLRTQVQFDLGRTRVVSNLLDGNYPDYRRIIPDLTAPPHTATLRRAELLAAVKRAAIFARDNNDVVRLILRQQVVQVSGVSALTDEGVTEVPATVATSAEPYNSFEIAFNARFLIDILAALDTETVRMLFSVPTRPGVFDTDTPGFVHVVMPMHIQQAQARKGK